MSGKEETRRNPDGFQEFLTQPDEKFSIKIRAGAHWYSFFVFASVKGDYGDALYPFFRYAVSIHVPRELRLQRVKNRSYQKFGSRMLPGGDLYEREQDFFAFAASIYGGRMDFILKLSCHTSRRDKASGGKRGSYHPSDAGIVSAYSTERAAA